MKYYIVQFWYRGPYVGVQDSSKESQIASKRLLEAHDVITALIQKAGFDWKLHYEFPDGSLYLYIKSEYGFEDTKRILERVTGREILSMRDGNKEDFDRKQRR